MDWLFVRIVKELPVEPLTFGQKIAFVIVIGFITALSALPFVMRNSYQKEVESRVNKAESRSVNLRAGQ